MNVLYITYDGLLDPLGGSQIIPYLKGISKHQDKIVVLSFEKTERLLHRKSLILSDMISYGIHWKYLKFTKNFGFFGNLWDLMRMYFWSFYLANRHNVQVVHARSHSPAQVASFLKKILKKKFIFDFRGLWVDERVDKGGWDLSVLSHRLQYKYFKRVERKLISQSDQIVVLTKKVVSEVVKLGASSPSKITVIPCCADFNHFPLSTDTYKTKARSLTGIPDDAFVLGYLGSAGGMYMLEKLFRLYELTASMRKDCHLLIITQDISALEVLMRRYLKPYLYSCVHIKSASRNEVPRLLPAMNIMISFISPSYARIAASPTKMAECFATGIPVIANPGVGDVASIIDELDGGRVTNPFSDIDLKKVVQELDEICLKGGQRLRDTAHSKLGLEIAGKCYQSVYGEITKTMIVRE